MIPYKISILGALIGLVSIAFASPAAASWPAEVGFGYVEVSGNYLSAERVAGIEGDQATARTTNVGARLYGEAFVAPQLQGVINLPLLEHYRFGDAARTRVGDLTLGARYYSAESQSARSDAGLVLFLGASLTIPTHQRAVVGEVYMNDGGNSSQAHLANGVFTIQPNAGITGHIGSFWFDFGGGLGFRTGYVNQFSVYMQGYQGIPGTPLSLTAGLHMEINQEPRPADETGADPIYSANGVGEFSEFIGWYLRADVAVTQRVSLGIGYDSAIRLTEYPASSAYMFRVAYNGRLWQAPSDDEAETAETSE